VVREVERAADRLYLIAHDPATGRSRLGVASSAWALPPRCSANYCWASWSSW
jgi:hypothetical protein